MKIVVKTADPVAFKTQALAVFLFTDDQPSLAGREELQGLADLIAPRLKSKDFTAKHLSTLKLFPSSTAGPQRVILVGLGDKKDFDSGKLRPAAAKAVQEMEGSQASSGAILLPPGEMPDLAEAAALGARLGQYKFNELKTKNENNKKPLQTLTLIPPDRKGRAGIEAAVAAADITAEVVATARDLVNRPGNIIYPETLAEEARGLAKKTGLKIRVLDEAAAEKKGMGSYLAVARGSDHGGRIIILEYKGAGPKTPPIALVGKAITFDSGGLCLKPPDGQLTMKTDMAGGAAVMATLAGAARMKLKVNLVGLVPAAENMPSAKAYRPGDVVKSMSGQTIEVINTDAEGRMILADALTMAEEFKPRAVIDLATLTGACVVALGDKCAGLMSTDDELAEALKKAGRASGERVWQLPLFDDYFDMLKSEVADFKHAGGRLAGTITAGLFLKQFVNPKTPWVHLDIAGPARMEKSTPDTPSGGTGFGVQLLLKYLREL